MTVEQTVLLVGGTGRTGRRVLEQLLSRDVNVRAIVRSAEMLRYRGGQPVSSVGGGSSGHASGWRRIGVRVT